jgi:hypothetical protein
MISFSLVSRLIGRRDSRSIGASDYLNDVSLEAPNNGLAADFSNVFAATVAASRDHSSITTIPEGVRDKSAIAAFRFRYADVPCRE